MTTRGELRALLTEGRHRLSVGRAREAAALAAAEPRLAGALVELLWDEDAGVATRAVDALERASAENPRLLARWKDALLGRMPDAEGNKLRWNLALLIGRVRLTAAEAERAARVLRGWLEDESSIVKTAALQGLADVSRWNPALRDEAMDTLRILGRSGTPAMRARSGILLKRMETEHGAGRRTLAG